MDESASFGGKLELSKSGIASILWWCYVPAFWVSLRRNNYGSFIYSDTELEWMNASSRPRQTRFRVVLHMQSWIIDTCAQSVIRYYGLMFKMYHRKWRGTTAMIAYVGLFKEHIIFWKKDQMKQFLVQIKTIYQRNLVLKSSFIWFGRRFNLVDMIWHMYPVSTVSISCAPKRKRGRRRGTSCYQICNLWATKVAMEPSLPVMPRISVNFRENKDL